MDVDIPDQPFGKLSPITPVFRPPSPQPPSNYESFKRASVASQVSSRDSRRSSNTSRRRRLDAHRKSDASFAPTERRNSVPVVTFRPVDHPPGGLQQQPTQLPNYDPRIYEQLSSFTFGAPPGTSAPRSATNPTFGSSNDTGRLGKSHSRAQSTDDTDASTEPEPDEEEQMQAERAKMRVLEDGTRRPSLPINTAPTGGERRRSTVSRLAVGVDSMQMDDVPEERPNEKSLPARLEPKPLPALPLPPFRDIYDAAPFLYPHHADTRSRFSPPSGYEDGYTMAYDAGSASPKMFSDASDAPSPSNNADVRESSPGGGIMESAEFQAILDHEWGTAFHIPGNISPKSSIEDPFMKMVEQYDPVYNKNRYAWTFKKNPPVRRPSRPSNTPKGSSSEPNHANETGPSNKEKEREKAGEGEPAVVMWSCQNVGQYGVWPGRTTPNGEHKRPSVLYAVGSEGSKRRGPTYLIHKHSRCHAFSIFQGYQVTGQKILASHAMLLSNKAIQFSFANSPEHKPGNKQQRRPHEPYEDDPEVMKLQTHNLMDDEPDTPEPQRQHLDIKPPPVSSPKQTPMRHISTTPERNLSRKPSNDVLRSVPRTGPSSFAVTEANTSPKTGFAETDDSVATTSTFTPAPRITPHAVAFDAVTDHPMTTMTTMTTHNLTRAPTNKFEWIKRAFGTGRPVGTATRIPGHGPPSASLDGTYSPPWLLMAPQSVKQEEERIIQGLNDSFRAVGLIPQPRVRPPPSTRPKRQKPRSPFLDPIPRDAMMMLMPLWIAEGGHAGGVAKHHVPMTERTYLLVYYVPFDSSGRSSDSVSSGKKRTRRDRDRSDRTDRRKPTTHSSGRLRPEPTEEEKRNAQLGFDLPPKKPKKVTFRVVAQMLSYADVRECGIKLPRFGLAVHGSLSDALLGNPTYHAVGENYPAVVAVCHGAESGLELVTEGLDKLGLRRNKSAIANEQQVALAAMEMDADALEEELQARQQPLTPIGKSVVEMIFAGCVSILEVGFR